MGLEEPEAGEITFRGRHWEEMSVPELEENRAAIGRVSSGSAWLSNLDLDENILLPASYHHRRSLKASRARAEKLAETFGLNGLPQRRPEARGQGSACQGAVDSRFVAGAGPPPARVPHRDLGRGGQLQFLRGGAAGGAAGMWSRLDYDGSPDLAPLRGGGCLTVSLERG